MRLVVAPTVGDHRMDHPSELVGGGRDTLGLAQLALHPPAVFAHPAFGLLQSEGRQSKCLGEAVAR